MQENLVIVESPAKAKTIEKFLGKKFLVKSSFGHIRDLSKKNLGIDIENNFQPNYEISSDKRKVVAELRKLAKEAKLVWLASDEDREGEAIAWHLAEVLKLKKDKIKRIVFNEITKNAITKAVKNPRDIDINLVNAQQARRVLDRLVGFELSPVLWKKIKPSLSAGRVQSVAVRLLVEREREIINFKATDFYKVIANFNFFDKITQENKIFKSELINNLETKEEALEFLNLCKNADFEVAEITKKPAKKQPSAPFTTSTLQQEASRKLHFSVAQTMLVAQKLYESGKITYMRTDSLHISKEAIKNIQEEIIMEFGEKYSSPRNFQSKIKGAQEAHEAIRPTYFNEKEIKASYDEQRLYNLIWKRTVASQMSDAKLEKTVVTIKISTSSKELITKGEVILFDGFLKVYHEFLDNKKEEKAILPSFKLNEKLSLNHILATQKFTHHSPRFSEARLVRKLEELGIGRPSTYAPTISTIQKRNYVIKEDREGKEKKIKQFVLENHEIKEHDKTEITGAEKSKLFPTDIGMLVNDFLIKNFQDILNYNFTAEVEKVFDNISKGQLVWNEMIKKFYTPFHSKVEKTTEESDRNTGERILGTDKETGKKVLVRMGKFGAIAQLGEKTETEKPIFANLSKEQHLETITFEEALFILKNRNEGRKIGKDPKTNKTIIARIGRYGAMVQLGENGELAGDEKPQYASLKKGQDLETLTLEEALDLLKLPRTLGDFENKTVVVAVGRFGPYVRHDSKFVSLKKTDDPMQIDLNRAVTLIEEKREADKKKLIKTFTKSTLTIVYDRWKNPCIFYKKKYTRLPKNIEIKDLSLDDCLELINEPKETDTKTKKTKAKKISTKKKKLK